MNAKDDDEKRHAINYDNDRKSLELEIDKLREECELLREKGARYDELFRDYQFTKQEKVRWRNIIISLNIVMHVDSTPWKKNVLAVPDLLHSPTSVYKTWHGGC